MQETERENEVTPEQHAKEASIILEEKEEEQEARAGVSSEESQKLEEGNSEEGIEDDYPQFSS